MFPEKFQSPPPVSEAEFRGRECGPSTHSSGWRLNKVVQRALQEAAGMGVEGGGRTRSPVGIWLPR